MSVPNVLSRIVGEIAKIGTSTGKYDDLTGGAKLAARQLIREVYHIPTIAAAADGSTDTVANAATSYYCRANGRVLAARFIPQASVTEHTANYVKIELHRLTGAGGSGTMIANTDTRPVANSGYGNITKATTVDLTLDKPNANFTKGQYLAPFIDQVSSGVALAAGTMVFEVEYEGVDAHAV